MNREQISNFFDRIRGRLRSNKKYRRLVGDFGKESLEDRLERYDFDHKERKLANLLSTINFKETDLESYRRLRREMNVDSFNASNPSLAARINRLDRKIVELESEIRDLRIIYEDERRKLDALRTIVRGPKENKVEKSVDLTLQMSKSKLEDKNESLFVDEPKQTQTTAVEVETKTQEKTEQSTEQPVNNQEGTQISVDVPVLEESKQIATPTSIEILSPEPSFPTTANATVGNISTKATVGNTSTNVTVGNTSANLSMQTQYVPNSNDPDYLKLIASDKMSEFARGYRMVKREERRSRTCKFLNEITTATGFGMMSLSAYFMYGLAAYDAPNGPIQFWETIGTDVVQKISSDPSFSNVMDALGHGPAQLLLGAVFLGVGLKGYLKYRRQFKEANAKRVDMEDLNAVTEAPITEHIARHI